MNDMPSKYKLTGDAKRLWNALTAEYGSVLKERHKPLLFAMCQQWDLYQRGLAEFKRNKDPNLSRQLYYRMSGSLKLFNTITKDFAMGINDQLQFTIPGELKPQKKSATKSRIEQLLEGVQDSNN